jgi:HD-like signal output (HDOD) protein
MVQIGEPSRLKKGLWSAGIEPIIRAVHRQGNRGLRVSQAAAGHTDAFTFIQKLAGELSAGKVELPSFPDVAIRVRKVLADEQANIDQVVRVVGSEPALAARLLKMSNSAAFSRGKTVTDLRTAINRMGFNMVRSAAMSFAMAQIRQAASLKQIERQLTELWEQSTHVAALAYVLARGYTQRNADEALLAGLLHGIGKLYILTRIVHHPALFADEAGMQDLLRTWHASIGKAILENWEMPEEVIQAVADHEDIAREHRGAPDLTDIVTVAAMMASYADHPDDIELNMQGIQSFHRLGLDGEKGRKVLVDTKTEIQALRQALGN